MRPYQYYVLSHDPPILCYLGVDGIMSSQGVPHLPEDLRPVTMIEYPLSLQNQPGQIEQAARVQKELDEQGIEHHLMVNAKVEEAWRIENSVRGAHLSQNAFVDENVFTPEAETKTYDAIHIAGMYDVKRHELARKVERLYVVTYNGKDLHAYRPELSHAEFNREYLNHAQISALINASVAGLCLSAVEGAMFASMEYLMCGVPVVTTPSKGGRDEFFDSTNSICVEPDAEAVRVGVEQWKRDPPEPEHIRGGALRKVSLVREGFCRYVADLINARAGDQIPPQELMKRFYSKNGIAARALAIKGFNDPRDLLQFQYDVDSAIPSRVPGFRQELRDGSLYLQSGTGLDMTIDSSGAIIWNLCDGRNSVHDIASLIAEAYEIDTDATMSHVRLTLRHFHIHGLIA